MSAFHLLCVLPAERHDLAMAVTMAGGTPVIDISCSDRHPIPAGAWVRSRTKRAVPGKGPVILCGGHHRTPIRNRETWLEVTKAQNVPKGFAGIILRGSEAGGLCGSRPGLELMEEMPAGQNTILDAGTLPAGVKAVKKSGAQGIVLSDILMALPELLLPTRWKEVLAQPEYLQLHQGVRVMAKPLSPGLKRLLGGESWFKVCRNWYALNNPKEQLWPAGIAAGKALEIANQFPSMSDLLAAYRGINKSSTVVKPALTAKTESPARLNASTEPTSVQGMVVSTTISNEPIAIIGLGCRFPKANSVDEFWDNLLEGRSAIVEVPKNRWEPHLFWDPDPKAPDKTYAKIGGFLTDFVFNSKKFRIPPRVANSVDPVQQLALESVAEALEDAKYTKEREFDRNRVAVILGNSMGGELTDDYTMRSRLPGVIQHLDTIPAFQRLSPDEKTEIREQLLRKNQDALPIINEDAMPGELANVIAGRIANAFNLNGPNYTVDAACASSMAAIQAAVKGLRDHEFDMAISGGADRSMGVGTYVKFSKIGALSATLSAPFDERASGFVMGEGCGILILKRLSDAQKDGDKIYATIRGVGASSDGKGKGITAPNPVGQRLALERAYDKAELDPLSVELFECHGTSTVVGDKIEVETLAEYLRSRSGDSATANIGSVKSNIGHLKSAAGSASLIKAALSIHHNKKAPSINFSSARSDVEFDGLTVQTSVEAWRSDIRRAGVSAFGFGGTNFHVVLEQRPENAIQVESRTVPAETNHQQEVVVKEPAPQPLPVAEPAPEIGVPPFLWATSAKSIPELSQKIASDSQDFNHGDPHRMVMTRIPDEGLESYKSRILKTLERGGSPHALRGRGIFIEDEPFTGKIAFLFTGQGSQYLDMGMKLADEYPIIAQTFEEAERTLSKELEKPLRDYIRRDLSISEAEQFSALQNTAISQPATLTIDIAIMRLLHSYGIKPDMVAGHSLGEYAATVAAGIMPFEDALVAVCARGREMAGVKIDDPGKMASISASPDKIEPILKEIPGYVVAANKNCAQQTVIAGESAAIEIAIERFREEKFRVHPLPVSHAFHSKIVSPASLPMKRVLQRLRIKSPVLPITTNVTGGWYPNEPEEIVSLLAEQVASPVEWLTQVETLYAAGARIFIECGPKRALTGFISSILSDRPHRAFFTNHPKRGDIESLRDALGGMLALPFPINKEPRKSLTIKPSTKPVNKTAPTAQNSIRTQPSNKGAVDQLAAQVTPMVTAAIAPHVQQLVHEIIANSEPLPQIQPVIEDIDVYCSGASVGLPGGKSVFEKNNIEALLSGENRISLLSPQHVQSFLDKNITRLYKDAQTGQGRFVSVDKPEDVIRLAGLKTHFDLARDYGVSERLIEALDITTQLAFAAGIEALKDAGIPLVAQYRTTSTGKQTLTGWVLPEEMRKDTGIVFACAFPGYTNLINHIYNDGQSKGTFDRRFLFQVLSMGHSQFAQFIGAQGPNTQVNAACASTTQAITIGSDWIKTRRAKRVIVIGADDVTNDAMLPWIGSGFLAAGAATTKDRIEEAALPFDKRRHGMILGMGAVGLILETKESIEARGLKPIARLLASHIGNSAFHGTRLLPDDIANEMANLVGRAAKKANVSTSEMAKNAVFVSHETYTPAKGGSAAAEIESLRRAFGEAASQVVIANTKGFTGHAMGAGIEDVLAVKTLQFRQVPPIPNLKEPDPELGDLHLSKGGGFSGKYAIRLAAGFGSQLALLLWEQQETSAPEARREPGVNWLNSLGDGSLFVSNRTLKWGQSPNHEAVQKPVSKGAPTESTTQVKTEAPLMQAAAQTQKHDYNTVVLSLLSEKTGYEIDDLDPEYELEADLGIDTVKQAEIFAEIQEQFGISETDTPLSEVQTIEALINWVTKNASGSVQASPQDTESTKVEESSPTPASNQNPQSNQSTDSNIEEMVIRIIAEQTGYDKTDIDMEYELEADLGIDTVKQAEIFSLLQEDLNIPAENAPILSDVQTISALTEWAKSSASRTNTQTNEPTKPKPLVQAPLVEQPTIEKNNNPPVIDSTRISDTIFSILAEKTGYEIEDLDPEYELEADLGIDTVKQAEVFADIQEIFGIGETDTQLSEVQTIDALVQWVLDEKAKESTGGTTSRQIPTAPPRDDGQKQQNTTETTLPTDVHTLVLETIATQTGYDHEDIDLDYELEADLGIDTVKQAEIFSTLQERLDISAENAPVLSEVQTISALIQWAKNNAVSPTSKDSGETASPENTAATPPINTPETTVDSKQPEASTAAFNNFQQRRAKARQKSSQRQEAETDTQLKSSEGDATLPDSIQVQKPVYIPCPLSKTSNSEKRTVMILGNHPCRPVLQAVLEQNNIQTSSTPDIVLDLGAQLSVLFQTAKNLNNSTPKVWLCLTQLDSNQSNELTALLGGRSGLCKALGKEWAECHGRVVDIHPTTPIDTIPNIILDELSAADLLLETHHRDGQRYASFLQPLARPENTSFTTSPNVVLTGGARGITAEIGKALVRKGVSVLTLLGRTEPAIEALDETIARKEIRSRLSENGRPTPKAIEDALRPLRKADEARQNMEILTSMGADVTFIKTDVTDPDQLKKAFYDANAGMNGIDVVIHGAGLEESRMLSSKEWSDFLRIYTPKATAALNILDILPEETTFVSMGSIAGRFGNPGQVDYSAANDAVAKVCIRRPNSLHVDWSAWADVGMASRGGMNTLLTKRGIELLPPVATANLLVDMLLADQQGEVLVAGALGDMETTTAHPFLQRIKKQGASSRAKWKINAKSIPWIHDHSIKGTPVLPGVIGVEIMAYLAHMSSPSNGYCSAQNVEFSRPIKLHREQDVTLDIEARPNEDNTYNCRVRSTRQSATGKTLEAEHFTGVIDLSPNDNILDIPEFVYTPYELGPQDIYQHFFHGPRFQVLSNVLELGIDGGTFTGRTNHFGIAPGLISHPLALEAAFQAAGLHRMLVHETTCLPAGFRHLEVFPAEVDGVALDVRVLLTDDGYDVDIDTETEAVLRLRGLKFADTGPFNAKDLPKPADGFKKGQRVETSHSVPDASLFDSPDWSRYHTRGTTKRITDRLAGRSAAKLALGSYLKCDPKQIHIDNHASGQPFCREYPELFLSISHCDGLGLATVSEQPVGMDVEKLEPRSTSFRNRFFTQNERALVQNDAKKINVLWTVKEATLKLLQLGLRVSPLDIEVVTLGNSHATISVHGKVADLFGATISKSIRIRHQQVHNYCIATALWHPHANTPLPFLEAPRDAA